MPPVPPSRTASRAAPGTLALLAWLAAVQPAAAPALLLAGATWSAALPSQASAQSRARPSSSGGYSRPSSGGSSYSRTPSFSASPRASSPRTPSFTGGYGLPSREPRPSVPSLSFGSQSAGDRAFSRERSREALGSYRAQRDAAPAQPRQWDSPSQQFPRPQQRQPSQPGSWFGDGSNFSAPRRYARPAQPAPDPRAQWYGQQGWSAPPLSAPLPAYGAGRSFGVWDGLFLWSLLSNLGRPGAADFFHNHRDDEGYRAWRSEADRLAQENADIRRRLEELDGQLAEREGQPKDPDYLPPDVPPDVAAAPSDGWEPDGIRTPSVASVTGDGGGGGYVWPVVLGGAGVLGFLAWRRRRGSATGAATPGAAAGGMSAMSGGTGTPLQAAGAMLRHKLSGEGYAPQRFRVGMMLQLDPTPFILAGNAIKLKQPQGAGQVSVKAVGRADAPGGAPGGALVRLYLPDDRSMVQLVVDPAGEPVECRLFGAIDEVAPADEAEWGVWLDGVEGLIGWPEFQTKDGKVYARAWSPGGGSRIEPRAITETVEELGGTRTVRSRAMLYAAPTGAAAPAPQAEYILVAAVDDGRQAWVEIRSGIDLNPATLQLA